MRHLLTPTSNSNDSNPAARANLALSRLSRTCRQMLLAASCAGAVNGWVSADSQLTGVLAAEQSLFWQDALDPQQRDTHGTVYLEPNLTHSFDRGLLSFTPVLRLDQQDSEAPVADIKELLVSYYAANWELNAGIGTVFWGQTESLHLIDIVNQTDTTLAIDGEDKLGQPMFNLKYFTDNGSLSLFVLPYFRERRFIGVNGRLRTHPKIDNDIAQYQSQDAKSHRDYALRWEHSFADLEFGLAYFTGTERRPHLQRPTEMSAEPQLQPVYRQIKQFSLDALYVWNSTLLKLEALRGQVINDTYFAYVAGLEHTVVNVFNTGMHLGLLLEHQYDQRAQQAFITGQNDLMLGARIAFNDFAGSEILLSYSRDLDNPGSYISLLEASTRLGDSWRLELQALLLSTDVAADPAYPLRRDDHLAITLGYHF